MATQRPAAVEPLEPRGYYSSTPLIDIVLTGISPGNARPPLNSLAVGSRDFTQISMLNTGVGSAQGVIGMKIYASADDKLDKTDRLLLSTSTIVTLFPHGTTSPRYDFTYPANLTPGSYHLIAVATPLFADEDSANNTFVSPTRITLTPPVPPRTVDYSISFAGTLPANFPFATRNTVSTNIRNLGNTTTSRPVLVGLYASPDKTFGNGNDTLLTSKKITPKIAPDGTYKLDLSFITPPKLKTGNYYIAAAIDRSNAVKDADRSNNVIFSGTKIRF